MISRAMHQNFASFLRERKKIGGLSESESNEVVAKICALEEQFNRFPEAERMEAMEFYYPKQSSES